MAKKFSVAALSFTVVRFEAATVFFKCFGLLPSSDAVFSDDSKACIPHIEAMKAAKISVQENRICYPYPCCNTTDEISMTVFPPKEAEHCTTERGSVEISGCSELAKVADNSSSFYYDFNVGYSYFLYHYVLAEISTSMMNFYIF